MNKLPKKIPEQIYRILKAFNDQGQLSTGQVKDILPEHLQGNIAARLLDLIEKDYLTRKSFNGPGKTGWVYNLSALGKKICKNIDNIIIVPKQTNKKTNKAKPKLIVPAKGIPVDLFNELPPSLTEKEITAIEILHVQLGFMHSKDLIAAMPEHLQGSMTYKLRDLETQGLIECQEVERPGKNTYSWKITDAGRHVYKNKDQIHIKKRKMKGNKAVVPAVKTAAPPPPPQLNVSSKTTDLMDHVSGVIQENANIRALMVEVYETIGKALELNQENEHASDSH